MGGGGQKDPPLSKICNTYPKMMKLDSYTLPKKDPKNTWITRHNHGVLLTSAFLKPESSKSCYIKKYRYRLYFDTKFLILLTFVDLLKVALINMVTVLISSAKMATPELLRIKGFLKSRLWRQNFGPLRHRKRFLSWFKLYCRCGRATKVC